jgi:hypothetical protein
MLDADDAKKISQDHGEWTTWQQAATDYWLLLHPELRHLRRTDQVVDLTVEHMKELAEHLSHAMDGIPSRWRLEKPSEIKIERLARVGWFHELLKGLYDPIRAAIEAAPRDPDGMELLVRFLEADVYCHRSGYMKSDVIRAIRRSPEIPEPFRVRLQRVVVHLVDGPDRREFRDYIRLAKKADDEMLRDEIRGRANAESEIVARHVRWMLDGLASSPVARR